MWSLIGVLGLAIACQAAVVATADTGEVCCLVVAPFDSTVALVVTLSCMGVFTGC